MGASREKVRSIESLRAALREAGDRHFRVEQAALAGTAIGLFLLAYAAYGLADYLVRFPSPIRVLLSLALAVATVTLWRRAAGRWLTMKRAPEDVARELEQRLYTDGASQYSLLISALQFSANPAIPGDVLLKNEAVRLARDEAVQPGAVPLHDPRHVRLAARWLAAAAVVYVVWGAIGLPEFIIFGARAFGLNEGYPTRTQVAGVDWRRRAAARADYPVVVRATGELPSAGSLSVHPRHGKTYALELENVATGVYRAVIGAPEEDFAFSFQLGDFRSGRYAVQLVLPPYVLRGQIVGVPPAYTGLKMQLSGLGQAAVPEGSGILLRVVPSRPVNSCVMYLGERAEPFIQERDAWVYRFPDPLTQSVEFGLRLRDADGIEDRDHPTHTIRVTPDQPPTVKIETPPPNTTVSASSTIRLVVSAEDDYGIEMVQGRPSLTLSYQVFRRTNEVETKVRQGEVPLAGVAAGAKCTAERLVAMREFQAAPGEKIVLKALARDQREAKANVGASDDLPLTVVTPEELRLLFEAEQGRIASLVRKLRDDEQRHADAIERRLKGDTP